MRCYLLVAIEWVCYPTPPMEPKNALITGAGRGIGRAVALALAREGLNVALLARTVNEIEGLAEECRTLGVQALACRCDVSIPEDVSKAVSKSMEALGPIDVLVNNAGLFLDKPMAETSFEEWKRIIDVNLTGAFLVTRAILTSMLEREYGLIIQIASSAGLQGYHGQTAYCASKHGLLGFSKALQLEVQSRGIRVHTLCPGGVATDFVKGTPLAERFAGQTLIQPEDLARLVVFLVKTPMNINLPEIEIRRFQR